MNSEALDPVRWTEWYTEHSRRLHAFLLSLLRNGHWAEETLQMTFAKALTHGGGIQQGSEQAWLFQVAFNEAMALRRRMATEQRAHEKLTSRSPQSEGTGEEEFLKWEEVRQVREALEHLPPDQIEIVQRRIYQEQTFQCIADELKLPLGTVLTRMRLALKKLREILKPPAH